MRESGAIEQDADLVLFIYRNDKTRDQTEVPLEEQNVADILIEKHRNGATGAFKLKVDPEMVSFKNIDHHHISE